MSHNKVFGQEVKALTPYSIQLEPTYGCDRRCWFCGLLGLPKELQPPNKFMETALVHKVFRELNEWLPKIRVEYDLGGEPTLNPSFLDIVEAVREEMPTASQCLQTNTENWTERGMEYIPAMFEAGLNILVLNAYKAGSYEEWKVRLEEWEFPYVDYYHDNPKGLSYYRYVDPRKHRQIFLLEDLGTVNQKGQVGKRTEKKLNNQGGNANQKVMAAKVGKDYSKLPLKHQCSKVFRELILDYDGLVTICCLDWLDDLVMGDAKTQSIREIWESERFWAVRQLLFRKRRDLLTPCNGCDDPTTRVGLLKDPGIALGDQELLDFVNSSQKFKGQQRIELT